MEEYASFIQKARELGTEEAEVISAETIETSFGVRWKCRYGCSDYGERLTCPPHVPSVEETKKMINEYNFALLLHGHDDPVMQDIVIELERKLFLAGHHKALGLACGPCERCSECGDSCVQPELARPSLEACGIDVYKTVRNNGYNIEVLQNEEEQPDYFALVLIE